VGDFREESGGGPDADSRHAGQDRPKMVCMHPLFNFPRNLVALFAQRCELLGRRCMTMVAACLPACVPGTIAMITLQCVSRLRGSL
jgi:hypothetical protein